MLRISKITPAAFLLAAALGAFSSCAGQSDQITDAPQSEAALLDNAEKATPVSDNPSVFADLAPNAPLSNELHDAEEVKTPEAATASADLNTATPADSSEPYYNSLGGENMRRISFTLYGDRKHAKLLAEKNPLLADEKKLESGKQVNFTFDGLKAQPKMLTKDLLDRYPSQLAESLPSNQSEAKRTKTTIGRGESLQMVSQRLYGTSRFWPELYLLNRDVIKNYDRVPAGIEIAAIERAPTAPGSQPMAPIAKQEIPEMVKPAPVAVIAETPKPAPAPVPAPMPVAPTPAPTPAPVVQTPVLDPIPETTAPSPVASASMPFGSPAEKGPTLSGATFFDNSANTRRAVYVIVILLVGAAAFALTRPGKKKNFDMLDVTSDTTKPRPKFTGGKDGQKLG